MSWETGTRTIFDVMNEHVGHSIQIRNVYQDDMITGIKIVCMTCGFALLQQDAPEPIPIEYEEIEGGEIIETPVTEGWDTGQPEQTRQPEPSEQGRDWQESQPVIPPSVGWEQDDTGWSTE